MNRKNDDALTPADGLSRRRFYFALCFGATLTSLIWLGVIEVGNARLNGLLQEMPRFSTQPWAHQYFTRQQVADTIVQQAKLAPDYATLTAQIPAEQRAKLDESINQTFAWEAGKNHLYRLLLSFGSTVYLLAILGITSAVLAFRTSTVWSWQATAAICGITCAGVLIRCLYLGVLTHGLLTAIA